MVGRGCTLLGLKGNVMPKSCQGHIKVDLDKKYKKYHFMSSNLIYV